MAWLGVSVPGACHHNGCLLTVTTNFNKHHNYDFEFFLIRLGNFKILIKYFSVKYWFCFPFCGPFRLLCPELWGPQPPFPSSYSSVAKFLCVTLCRNFHHWTKMAVSSPPFGVIYSYFYRYTPAITRDSVRKRFIYIAKVKRTHRGHI
jgi:hypothetical protein